MNGTWAKLTASTLLLGTAAIGCTTTAGLHPAMVGSSGPQATKLAARAAAQASSALAAHHGAAAARLAETAVAAAPQDASYRALLGQAYLQAGRFGSADSALSDAMTLDPQNGRAGLSLALAQAAVGKPGDALTTLRTVRDLVAPTDLGLALALCGDRDSAVRVLAGAARDPHAGVRARQNLAFALALGGQWVQARAVAAQDVSPADLDKRMTEWAALASAKRSSDQIAAVLGVTPASDPGEPAMLALAQPAAPAPFAAPEATAAAAPAPAPMPVRAPAAETTAAAPVASAPVTPPVAQVAEAQPAPIAETPIVDVPAQSFVTAQATTPAPAPLVVRDDRRAASDKPAARRVSLFADAGTSAAAPKSGSGQFAVQLGAFARPQAPQVAWEEARGRFIQLASFSPSSGTFSAAGHASPLYRLSIAGFATRPDAVDVCVRIKARGGECFVRHEANDQLADWGKPGKGLALASR